MQVEQDIFASALVRVYLPGPLELWKKDPSGNWKLVPKDKWKNSKPTRAVFKRLLVQPGRRLARSTIEEDDLWQVLLCVPLTSRLCYNSPGKKTISRVLKRQGPEWIYIEAQMRRNGALQLPVLLGRKQKSDNPPL